MAVNAAVTLLCLGFLAGFFLVLSFLERPILPIMTTPHTMREHESDVRWTHSQLQTFVKFVGMNSIVPASLIAFLAAGYQMVVLDFNVIAVLITLGAAALFFIACIHAGPAMRNVRDTSAYEDDLDSVSVALFRMVRLHHIMFLVVIPLTLAQLFLLFVWRFRPPPLAVRQGRVGLHPFNS